MSVLKYLETNFNKQSIKTKIELFVFPLIISIILIVSINYTRDKKSINNDSFYIKDTISGITMKNKMVNILNDFESFIKTKEIELNKISNNKQSIQIEINANLFKQLLFMKFIEDYNSFSKIKYLKQESNLLVVEMVFDKLYIKNSFNLKNSLNSFQNNKNINSNLFAIVDNSVLINNRWLKVGDLVESFKIIDIKKNEVILDNGFRIIKLKINKNENN